MPGARPSGGERQTSEQDLTTFDDLCEEAANDVNKIVGARKDQHKRWNQHWTDGTMRTITPPPESAIDHSRWGSLELPDGAAEYPSPPATEASPEREQDGDVEMKEEPLFAEAETDAVAGAEEPEIQILHIPGSYPISPYQSPKRNAASACRLRRGRGGRCFLEARKRKRQYLIASAVISDSDSDDEDPGDVWPVSPNKVFDYRVHTNKNSSRPEDLSQRRSLTGGSDPSMQQQQLTAGNSS